jgi:hypothetical protein
VSPRKPWYERLTETQRARWFADETVEAFAARMADQETRFGIPQKCEHIPTLLHIARIVNDYTPDPPAEQALAS